MVQSLLFIVTSCGWKKSCTTLPLGLVKPYKWWDKHDKPPINWCRVSSIHHIISSLHQGSHVPCRPGGRGRHIDVEEVHLTMLRHLRAVTAVTNKKGLVRGSPYGMNMLCQRNAIGILWPHAAYSCHYITSIVLECRRYIRPIWDPVTTCSLLMLLQMLGQSRLDMFGNTLDK